MNTLKLTKLTTTATIQSSIKFRQFTNLAKFSQQTQDYGYLKEFEQFLNQKNNNDKLIIKLKSSSETSSSGKINNINEVKVEKLKKLLNSNKFNNDDYRFKLEGSNNLTLYYKSSVLNDLGNKIKELGSNKNVKLEDIQNDGNEFEVEKRLNKE